MASNDGPHAPGSDGDATGGRPAWVVPTLVVLTIAAIAATVLLVLAARDDTSDDEPATTTSSTSTSSTSVVDSTTTASESTTTSAASSSTSVPSSTSTSEAADGPTVQLTISSGLDETFEVTSCDNPDETTITLEAQTDDPEDPLLLSVEATDGTGTIVLSGAEEAEGTVEQIEVDDSDQITASGTMGPADDPSDDTFELTGSCA